MLELALDRAPENRTYDTFGKLHVRVSNIAKACVSPYKGSEIPNHSALGLDADKVYMLLRSPEELEKAASTFNNIPVLQRHVPVTPDAPSQEEVVGSTGTDCIWSAPYLTNSLVVWVAEAIAGIESEEEHEISPGYAYKADMTPGSYEGLHYDGIMRNIIANHLALVSQGRQGPDVVVGDAKPEFYFMAKAALTSRKAIFLYGGLMASVLPLLAVDAKPVDFTGALEGVTAKNFPERKAAVAVAVKKAFSGVKLAQDADLAEVIDKVLDRLEPGASAEEDEADVLQPAVDADEDADPMAQVLAYCKSKMGEDDFAELQKLSGAGAADDADEDAPAGPEDGAPKPGDDPQAMDAAAIEQRVLRKVAAAAEARTMVEPLVGKVSMALDTAEAIFGFALDHEGVTHKGVNGVGKRALVEQRLAAKTKADGTGSRMALDSAAQGDAESQFRADFPSASRLRR